MKKLIFLPLILLYSCSRNGFVENLINIDNYYIKDLEYKDFSIQRLENIDVSQLKEIDSNDYVSIRQKKYNSAKHYYYSIKNISNINSVVYFYFNEGKEKAFVLENYDNDKQLLSEIIISSIAGDGGYFSNSEGRFINDSTIIREDETGYYNWVMNPNSDNDDKVIESYNKLRIILKRDGSFKTDTIN